MSDYVIKVVLVCLVSSIGLLIYDSIVKKKVKSRSKKAAIGGASAFVIIPLIAIIFYIIFIYRGINKGFNKGIKHFKLSSN